MLHSGAHSVENGLKIMSNSRGTKYSFKMGKSQVRELDFIGY